MREEREILVERERERERERGIVQLLKNKMENSQNGIVNLI